MDRETYKYVESSQKNDLIEAEIDKLAIAINEELQKTCEQTMMPRKPENPDRCKSKMAFQVFLICFVIMFVLPVFAQPLLSWEPLYELCEIPWNIASYLIFPSLIYGLFRRKKESVIFYEELEYYEKQTRAYRDKIAFEARARITAWNELLSRCLEHQRMCLAWISDIEEKLLKIEVFATMFMSTGANDAQGVISLQKVELEHARTVLSISRKQEAEVRNKIIEIQRIIDTNG